MSSKIGLQMYTVRDHITTKEDYLATLKKVADIGYENIQTRTMPFYTPEENKAVLDHYGLTADSVLCEVGRLASAFESNVRECGIYHTDVLRTTSIPAELRKQGRAGYLAFAEEMEKLGARYYKEGIKLMYHFHAFEFVTFGDTRGIDILLQNTDPKHLYFMPDVFWLTNAGTEPSVSLYMFRDRAIFMHVKDYAVGALEGQIESVPHRFAPVGCGNLNWDGILKAGDTLGVRQYVVEQDVCDGDVFECIRTSFQNLKKMGID